jgi:hypothetical protein
MENRIYLDLMIEVIWERSHLRLRPQVGERIDGTLRVRCSRKFREQFQIGQHLRMDVKVVVPQGNRTQKIKPYLVALKNQSRKYQQLSLFI